ncbi:MAG TPA: beta-ketoacyl-[acyl-carrier-protein] synthase II [Flavobacteriales bacterium]|nr:beta-ketoacyl-[acyl-carrier-protein] synthase II [Flavobacteriales bacterium]HIO67129.1 beta-ketoacyl-[acyl-carrier-protein] synthase II [Flavobacteriales bacterium]
MKLRRVVVTGLGAMTPLGNSVTEYWKNLVSGVSGADTITRFDHSLFKTHFACEVKDFDPLKYFDRKEARKLDLYAQFAVATSEEAIKDSGLDLESLNMGRAGVILGVGIGGLQTFFNECVNFAEGGGVPRFNPFFIPKMIADIASGHISIKHGFQGPNYTVVSACASSTNALIDCYNLIRLGKADVFISGGAEAAVNQAGVGGFNAMHALSVRNDDPKTASRPFDVDRDGFVLGEGAGILILEDLEHAQARGAKIYAEIVAGGMSADAHHITAPHPKGLGAKLVMQSALEEYHGDKEDVDYINVHGTSTPLGDISESMAILDVFGDHAYNLNISSTKSMTGHLLGAAGAIEAIACIMAIKDGVIPPTINHFNDDPDLDNKLNFTFHKAEKKEVKVAMSNTFGFGGHNATVMFEKFEG